ncbi:phosphoribosylglycinamide formyltransferase [Mangrovibacterium diazotrophicum]|uniref:Phosphoribosylglycinamide formyltransferase n=1 Tax=Mangrovibacterium diazotrophicum TaxID=1261403 RepID=A0A419W7S2_9BACT|nr:phosphoribosylglycinamide formyltransferase [Mangrovibacterium diazotrophicum]RKD91514.1 formyltetrahydrofolate-dependent phosphoribosylglycinamide formyltransferase [Mangrovibacterium diazotrophicum]
MKRIAIFASGSGTNAQNIIEYFKSSRDIQVDSLWSNNEDAYALIRAEKLGIETFTFDRDDFYHSIEILEELSDRKVDMIVLAGFLWLVPNNLTEEFVTVNIHPALLPKYGGKGMYGKYVHEAVLKNKDKESGITIHFVNDRYDSGGIIFQATCPVMPGDTAESLAERVHKLEYEHFPRVIEEMLMKEEAESDYE